MQQSFIGGKETLRQIQTDFAELVSERFGLERGRERSQAKHTTLREYYALANQKPESDLEIARHDRLSCESHCGRCQVDGWLPALLMIER
ncbi:hypothetical protein ETW24_15710 [Leisingera sp. NJS204]|nr:hypothetical protein ETW24_15710 [Leisingera sp. NJS204]